VSRSLVIGLVTLLCSVAQQASAADRLVMNLGGDVAFPDGQAFIARVDERGRDLFRWIDPILARGDFNFVNLECPLSTVDEPPPTPKRARWVYRCHPKRLGYLLDAHFNLFSLANNHALDQGMVGVRHTLRALETIDLDHRRWWTGMSVIPQDRIVPRRLRRGKATVSFFAVAEAAPKRGPVTSLTHPDLAPALRRARSRGDVVVVSVHGGSEYVHLPSAAITKRYRALISAGAQLVVGHHPHVVQGIERYREGVILYSLGNLSFSTFSTRHRKQGARLYGLLARVVVGEEALEEVELIPLWVDDTSAWRIGDRVLDPRPAEPQLLGGVFADRVLTEVDRFSRAIGGASELRLVRVGARSYIDLGQGRGVPRGAKARRRIIRQRRAYHAVTRHGAGPRAARPKERFDTQDDRPATLRDRYIP